MSKKILYQDNARKALEKGMKIMVEAVAVTLGPRGRNVVLCLLYTSPSPRDATLSRMPSSA